VQVGEPRLLAARAGVLAGRLRNPRIVVEAGRGPVYSPGACATRGSSSKRGAGRWIVVGRLHKSRIVVEDALSRGLSPR
jgi:hypothetical protein